MVGAGPKENRRPLDFYPTPPEVTEALFDFMDRRYMLTPQSVIWEPAAGDGNISEVFKRHGHKVISTDIRHTGYGRGGVDFLKCDEIPRCDWIITNPPFNVAEDFINRCMSIGVPFALLLKSQYWHAGRRYKLFYKRRPAYVLPLTWRPDFTGDGASLLDMAWTIWDRSDSDTRYIPVEKPRQAAGETIAPQPIEYSQMTIYDFVGA